MFRRRKLPAAKRPPLADDERILAWAGATGEAVLVVTNLGLRLPGVSGPTRLGWHEIHQATWAGRSLRVVPAWEKAEHETYVEMADSEPLAVTLLDPDKVPAQVQARVTKSVAYTSRHARSTTNNASSRLFRMSAASPPRNDVLTPSCH